MCYMSRGLLLLAVITASIVLEALSQQQCTSTDTSTAGTESTFALFTAGAKLTANIIASVPSTTRLGCLAKCYNDLNCTSLSVKDTQAPDGTFECNLSDAVSWSANFNTTAEVGHTVYVGPCKPNVCIHGTCLKGLGGFGSCVCSPEFRGDRCDLVDLCPTAPCVSTNTLDCESDGATYTCVCDSGYSGDHCEIDSVKCARNPACQNGGVCAEWTTTYYCECAFGYLGRHCENIDMMSGLGAWTVGSDFTELPLSGYPITAIKIAVEEGCCISGLQIIYGVYEGKKYGEVDPTMECLLDNLDFITHVSQWQSTWNGIAVVGAVRFYMHSGKWCGPYGHIQGGALSTNGGRLIYISGSADMRINDLVWHSTPV